jgi:hypothetical protein
MAARTRKFAGMDFFADSTSSAKCQKINQILYVRECSAVEDENSDAEFFFDFAE